jgi:hypothetical protein
MLLEPLALELRPEELPEELPPLEVLPTLLPTVLPIVLPPGLLLFELPLMPEPGCIERPNSPVLWSVTGWSVDDRPSVGVD